MDNGTAALEKLDQMTVEPDLILVDLMMPGISGFEIIEKIKNSNKNKKTKIIVFSNLNETKDRERCFALGADDFILKANITPKELVEKIKLILLK